MIVAYDTDTIAKSGWTNNAFREKAGNPTVMRLHCKKVEFEIRSRDEDVFTSYNVSLLGLILYKSTILCRIGDDDED